MQGEMPVNWGYKSRKKKKKKPCHGRRNTDTGKRMEVAVKVENKGG